MDRLRGTGIPLFSMASMSTGLLKMSSLLSRSLDTGQQSLDPTAPAFHPTKIDINYFFMPWEHNVCSKCLETNPYAIWLVKVGCLKPHSHHTASSVTVVIEHECMKMISIRPMPANYLVHRGDHELCSKYFKNLCTDPTNCVYAHSVYEFDTWNTKKCLIEGNKTEVLPITTARVQTQSPSQVCQMCLQQNPDAIWLSWLKCVSPIEHSACPAVTLVANNIDKQLVIVRPLPADITSIEKVRRCQRQFCPLKEQCGFAHTSEELNYWKWQIAIKVFEENDSEFSGLYSSYKYPDEITACFIESLKSPLTLDNYKSKYHKLIYLEEIESSRKIIQECDSTAVEIKVNYLPDYSSYGEFESPSSPTVYLCGLNSMAIDYASSNKCSAIFTLKLPHRDLTYSANVKSTPDYEREALVIDVYSSSSFYSHFSPDERTECAATVHFEISHSHNYTLHRIIDCAPMTVLRKLLPATPLPQCQYPIPVKSKFIGSVQLDERYQKKALSKMLTCSPGAPFLLLGPFGTGKTYLLAAGVVKILEEDDSCKILVCTHQNRCADGLCQYIQSNMGFEDTSNYILRVVPTQEKFEISTKRLSNIPILLPSDPAVYRDRDWPVVVTTFTTAYHFLANRDYLNFTHILIDEGAQCSEPEVLGALVLAKSHTKVVVVGDNKQVGPKVRVVSDKARDNGLGSSLLERLYDHYTTDVQLLNSHTSTLLTNYRCHPSILMMASSLFYECTLISRSSSKTHPNAPYPLVLVCTSFNEEGFENRPAEDEEEAHLLITKMIEYIKSWPKESLVQPIGLLASTKQQVACLRRMWKKCRYQLSYQDRLVRIEIMPTYNIQGEEFSAVFLSTCEATDQYGMPCNSIKSICNEYVFNTVFTRARSLVCVAGNPFLLIRMGSGFKTNCWLEYIKRCLQCESLLVSPQQLDATQKQNLPAKFDRLFKKTDIIESLLEVAEQDCQDFDAIIERYIDDLQKRGSYKIAKNLVQGPTGELKWVEESTANPNSKNIVWCKLNCKNFRQVTATPLNKTGKQVQLKGLANRRCGFHGDIVRVDTSKKCVLLDEQTENAIHSTHFGESFVCRVSPDNPVSFLPIDKRHPRFVNLPMLTQDQNATNEVVCFDPKSINNVPKVNNFIPMKCAVKMVFVVKFLGWNKGSIYPLGIIVGALPSAQSPIVADLFLRVSNSVPPVTFPPWKQEQIHSPQKKTPPLVFEDAFTIDPKGSTDHDDALTCRMISHDSKTNQHIFEVGVHITDVQRFVPKDGDLDRIAYQRGCSFYKSSDNCVSSMLPKNLIEKSLSFSPGATRNAQSILTCFTFQNGKVSSFSVKPRFAEALVTSSVELTYTEAERYLCNELVFPADHILDTKTGNYNLKFSEGPHLEEKLQILWKVAMFLRNKRLGEGMYSFRQREQGKLCPEAHHLVEELMVWANSKVAERVLQTFPKCTVVRVQDKPDTEQMTNLKEKYSDTMSASLSLKSHLSKKKRCNQDVILLKSMNDTVKHYLDLHLVRYALFQVQYEHQHPMTAVVTAKCKKIQSSALYQRSDKPKPVYRHDMLRCEQYTHFTSPVRRYIDIVMQRLLHAVLHGLPCPYKHVNEVDDICSAMTNSLKCSNAYDRDVRKSDMTVALLNSSREYEACVIENKDTKNAVLEFHFFDPDLTSLSPEEKMVPVKYLKSTAIPSKWGTYVPPSHQQTVRDDHFKWQVKVASFSSSLRNVLSHPDLQLKSNISEQEQIGATFNIFSTEIESATQLSALKETVFHAVIDPLTYVVPITQWNAILSVLKSDPKDISSDSLRLLSSTGPTPQKDTLTHKKYSQDCSICVYTVNRALNEGEVLHVQLSASCHSNHKPPTPCIQLIEVAPELRVCIHHNSNPSECFTDKLTVSATRQKYSSIKKYFELWEPVLLAEAAVTSVSDGEILLIKDVKLNWPVLEPKIDSVGRLSYRLPTPVSQANAGVRMDLPNKFIDLSYDFFQFNTGDLVCIRYDVFTETGVELCRTVYHMVVHNVVKKLEKKKLLSVTVFMRFVCESMNVISTTMEHILTKATSLYGEKLTVKCEVQLIPLTLPFRRIYRCLHDMMFEVSASLALHHSLAEEVALGFATTKVNNPQSISTILTEKQTSASTSLWPFQRRGGSRHSGRKKLNKFQRHAIDLACSNRFTLIQGPPGTGKSVTGAHMAYALAMKLRKERLSECTTAAREVTTSRHETVTVKRRRSCVMYCAPSNHAVNVVLDMLIGECPVKDEIKIVRVFSKIIEQKQFPGPTFHQKLFHKNASTDTKCEPNHKPYALHEMVRRAEPKIAEYDQKFKLFQKQEKIPSQSDRMKYRALLYDTELKILSEDTDIVLCTCNEASSHRIMNSIKPVYCIIDECAMSTEPECMVPICNSDHVVLTGDHKQLSPVIKNRKAEEMGLGTSLFLRYANEEAPLQKPYMLQIQYRMHPELCRFPSKEFYGGKLETDESIHRRRNPETTLSFWPQGSRKPFVFCNIVGEERQMHPGRKEKMKVSLESKFNPDEARKTAEIITVLMRQHNINAKAIAVLTPYSAQKEEISQTLIKKQITEVTVKTITESQGSEYGIVILSTVRSKKIKDITDSRGQRLPADIGWQRSNLGFVTDRNRICVGITRCKYGLVIVGNKTLLSYDKTWRRLIEHYQHNGCVRESASFPPRGSHTAASKSKP